MIRNVLVFILVVLWGVVVVAQIQAGSGATAFRVSVHLPAAVSDVSDKADYSFGPGTVLNGYPADIFEEERTILGEKVIFRTRVLR